MIIYGEVLSEEAQAIADIVQRVDDSGVFNVGEVRRREVKFKRDKSLPFLGKVGVFESLDEIVYDKNAINLWFKEDGSMKSIAIRRELRQLEGGAEGVRILSGLTIYEQTDGNGINWAVIDPIRLTMRGCYQCFGVIVPDKYEEYPHSRAIGEANSMIDRVISARIPVAEQLALPASS